MNMGDKTRIGASKPVKNPLLSGAGHGFPFENFQGTSLLVPVSQDSSSVLGGDVGEPDKFLGQDSPGIAAVAEPLHLAPRPAESARRPPEATNQGYTGLFSAFFGGSSQAKPEVNPFPVPAPAEQPPSLASTPRSYSPYVHVQSFSPSLQVPRDSPSYSQGFGSNPAEGVVPEQHPPLTGPSSSSFNTVQPLLPPQQHSVQPFAAVTTSPQQPPQVLQPFGGLSTPPQQPSQVLQPFGGLPAPPQVLHPFGGLSAQPRQPPPHILQPFGGLPAPSQPPPQVLQPFGGLSAPPQQPPQVAHPPFSPPESGGPVQPPPAGSSRTFRLGQQKRLVYAPLPGLTSNAPVQFQPFDSVEPIQAVAPALFTPLDGASSQGSRPGSVCSGPSPSLPVAASASSVSESVPPLPLESSSNFPSSRSFPALSQSGPPPPAPGTFSYASAPSSSSSLFNIPPTASPETLHSIFPPPVSNPSLPSSDIPFVSPTPPFSQPFPTPSAPPVNLNPLESVAPPLDFPVWNAPLFEPPGVPSFPPSFSAPAPAVPSATSHPLTNVTFVPLSQTSSESNPAPHPIGPPSASFPPSLPPGPSAASLSTPSSTSLFSPITDTSFNPPPVLNPTVSLFNRPTAINPVVSVPGMSAAEQSATLSPMEASQAPRTPSPSVVPPSLNNLANLGQSGLIYRPAYHHWFLRKEVERKELWQPFSMSDSLNLEQAFNSTELTINTAVPTDGGRYDVKVAQRRRYPVYWEEQPKEVRRCSWFYHYTTENRFRPYDENTAYVLEEEYKEAVTNGTWRNKINLGHGEYVIFYGPNSMAHFQETPQSPDAWDADTDLSQSQQTRARVVKRGVLDDFEIDEGESPLVDHLVFVVHGVGSVCDLKMRSIEEAVEDFRSLSHQLVKTHYRSSVDLGLVNRIEVLPVSWHHNLHGETTGLDKKVHTLTLKSIPKVRHFMNDCLLDILYYTSPVYCQNIQQKVAGDINSLLDKFKSRNPCFVGGVSVMGHSLGSLILFDMLCHQKPPSPVVEVSRESTPRPSPAATPGEDSVSALNKVHPSKRRLSRNISYVIGTAGTGQPFINYPQLNFNPTAFFAMGSPIGMFVTVRGIDTLGLDFKLPTCPGFFNIFHPYDPVAYRVEALINSELADKRAVLIPHHKGRKRMHLELRETMARVGADLKQRLVESVRSTWNTVYQLTVGRTDDMAELEKEVEQAVGAGRPRLESTSSELEDGLEAELNSGSLNQGRRVDYVLQEAPLESFNEYVSALTSHVIYWDSHDTMLLVLREIYTTMGIFQDSQSGPTQEDFAPSSSAQVGMDPTTPPAFPRDLQPPPMSGFVKK